MLPEVPENLSQLHSLIAQGEGATLEFKRSTAELREGMQTLCGFLNGEGGMVLFGVRPDGKLEGQQVADITLRDIAQALDRFEPPVNIPVSRLEISHSREIQSYGRLPFGVTVEQLAGPHDSELRNPLIAEAFHRTGAVEVWGRGTNRVIAECERHGIPAPTFEERHNYLVVTFRAAMVVEPPVSTTPQVTAQVTAQVALFCREPRSARAIMEHLGLSHWKTFQTNYLNPLLEAGLLERTIPDKPQSRLQKYRLTEKGRAWLAQHQAASQ